MNKINFNQTGGFPLDTDILNFMQNAYTQFNALGEIAGNLAILKGCEVTGNSVSDGAVFIGGEVLYFKGGTLGNKVIIKEDIESLTFEDGSSKEVEITRYATFGNGVTAYNWADFFRIKDNKTLNTELEILENKLSDKIQKLADILQKTIPIGLVAIWDRPADQIPEGWVEHTDLQGLTPVGRKVGDTDFGQLGKTLGAKTHTLTIAQMPEHKHEVYNAQGISYEILGIKRGIVSAGDSWAGRNAWDNTDGNGIYWGKQSNALSTKNTGGGQPHNNIQPSRIVRFIRFVGW